MQHGALAQRVVDVAKSATANRARRRQLAPRDAVELPRIGEQRAALRVHAAKQQRRLAAVVIRKARERARRGHGALDRQLRPVESIPSPRRRRAANLDVDAREQHDPAEQRVVAHRGVLERPWFHGGCPQRPVEAVVFPRLVGVQEDACGLPAVEHHHAAARIVGHAKPLARSWRVGGCDLRPRRAIELPRLVEQLSVEARAATSAKHHDAIADRIMNHLEVAARRRHGRRVELRPIGSVERPHVVAEARTRLRAAEHDRVAADHVEGGAAVVASRRRGGRCDLCPLRCERFAQQQRERAEREPGGCNHEDAEREVVVDHRPMRTRRAFDSTPPNAL